MSIRKLLLIGVALALPLHAFAADPVKPITASPKVPSVPAAATPTTPTPPHPTPPTPPAPRPPAPTPPAPPPPPAPPAPAARELSWIEVTTFAPGLCDYNDAFKARMAATCKLKLRYLRRQCNFIAMVNPDPAIRAKAKQIAENCKALIGK